MFQKPLFIFIFCLACLGAGTVWVIENKSGTHILPKSMRIFSYSGLNKLYENGRLKAMGWWYQVKNGVSPQPSNEDGPTDTRKIIKWQDKEGTWHFEYEKTAPSENPTN